MDEEIYSIEKSHTLDVVDLLEGKVFIWIKWVYKTKFNKKGEVQNIRL